MTCNGISANAVYVAGFGSLTNGVKRPVVWVNAGTPIDLAANLGTTRAGTNYAVNSSGVSVGQVQYTVGGSTVWRGFRTTGGTNAIATTGDDLPPPGGGAEPSAGYGLNSLGVAVGSHVSAGTEMAAMWPSRSGGSPNAVAVSLTAWVAPSGLSGSDYSAKAAGINHGGWIVGTSTTSAGTLRAVARKGPSSATPWVDLLDRHFVHGVSGWVLQNANAISSNNVIVGSGTLNGMARGFILTPRTTGN